MRSYETLKYINISYSISIKIMAFKISIASIKQLCQVLLVNYGELQNS